MKIFYKIHKPSNYIFDYLTDMQKFATVHPVIKKITNNSDGNYLIYETLKFGFLPFSFTYPATIEHCPKENKVIMRATVMKLTNIEITFALMAGNGFTAVEETIHFKSPLPVKSILKSIFKRQHQELFKNIEMAE